MNPQELLRKSLQYRRDLVTYIYESGAGHTGGSLSCVDIINVLYNAVMDITNRAAKRSVSVNKIIY